MVLASFVLTIFSFAAGRWAGWVRFEKWVSLASVALSGSICIACWIFASYLSSNADNGFQPMAVAYFAFLASVVFLMNALMALFGMWFRRRAVKMKEGS
ncbi:hypothetical protein SAMN05421512_107253 [Stappia indica]|uniref:Uncharacterized protein n=2 Tax=Stappia indica TaxID=538381 RepID=A0A285SYL4_9HYPH|nr:hypothetical protein SAMN05421512_107253 [Stappia indica]